MSSIPQTRHPVTENRSSGATLFDDPAYNKGKAFTKEERRECRSRV
jgi:hypothetical protein